MPNSIESIGQGQAAGLAQPPLQMSNPNSMMGASSLNFAQPNPDSDWLFHGT